VAIVCNAKLISRKNKWIYSNSLFDIQILNLSMDDNSLSLTMRPVNHETISSTVLAPDLAT
jgi:hypothetical protein